MCRGAAHLHDSHGGGNLEVGPPPARPNAPRWTRERLFALFSEPLRDARPIGRRMRAESNNADDRADPDGQSLAGPARRTVGRVVAKDRGKQMVDAILTMKKEGVSILSSEQEPAFRRLISDRAYIIERGRICFPVP